MFKLCKKDYTFKKLILWNEEPNCCSLPTHISPQHLLELAVFLDWIKFISLRKKCSYSEVFWSAFSRIRTETRRYGICGKMRGMYINFRMWENADQSSSKYGLFLCSVYNYSKYLLNCCPPLSCIFHQQARMNQILNLRKQLPGGIFIKKVFLKLY